MLNGKKQLTRTQCLSAGLIFLLLLVAMPVAAQTAEVGDVSYGGDDPYDPAAGGLPGPFFMGENVNSFHSFNQFGAITIFPFRITSKINVGGRGHNTYHDYICSAGWTYRRKWTRDYYVTRDRGAVGSAFKSLTDRV